MEPCKDGLFALFQKLCNSVLAQVLADSGDEEDRLLSIFHPPDYHPLSSKFKNAASRQLLWTTFDLLLLRKWVWFGMWEPGMSPECRCLSHTYRLHQWGLHEEAQRLEQAVGHLLGEGVFDKLTHLLSQCPIRYKTLHHMTLLVEGSHEQ